MSIQEQAESKINLFYKHAKGQTDVVRLIHAKVLAIIHIKELIQELERENFYDYTQARIDNWKNVKSYIENKLEEHE